MVMDLARVYQAKLDRCRTRYDLAKRQDSVGASGSRFGAGDTPHGEVHVDSLSSVGSISPQDSASQAGQVLPLEGQFATMFVHSSPLQSMLSDMIASQPMVPSRVQEALLTEGAQEVARAIECSFGLLAESWTACSNMERQMHPATQSKGAIIDFICEKFLDACGPVVQDSAPLLPGMQRSEVPATTPRLRCAHPIDFMMSQASEALTCANKSSKLSFVKYPVRQHYRSYRTSIDEGKSLPAKVNPDLVQYLTVCGDLQVLLSQGEMMYFEEALLITGDTQNFLFWLMSTFFFLTSLGEGSFAHGPKLHQHTHSIQRATVDQAGITVFALTNTRAVWRESYLSHLPHQFSSVSKAQLHHSDVDSDLLFNLASVEKAIDQAQQAVLVLLTEAAAKALIKVKPRPRTPLDKKHPRPSTSADSHPRPGLTQQRFSIPHFPPFWTSLFKTVKDPDISEMTPLLQLLQLEAALPDITLPGRT
ncbi:hypothetical protein E2C01_045534 [Portunus trituberculatus]|uniref:Uncharacterized protein n=1 Tax=Portunus trituberculatus TaxID=210409 RepID=A0A5B7FYL3_PORTR|nr:hypothetical protein [Portunus trituberculatus]